MTTICCDSKTVASDGLICAGDEPIAWNTIKITRNGDEIIGGVGCTRYIGPALEWYRKGCDPAAMPKTSDNDTWTVIVFRKDEAVTYSNTSPYPQSYPYPTAFGSGQDYAMGALLFGATAEEALRIVMRLDLKTGGRITVLDIPAAVQLAEAAE